MQSCSDRKHRPPTLPELSRPSTEAEQAIKEAEQASPWARPSTKPREPGADRSHGRGASSTLAGARCSASAALGARSAQPPCGRRSLLSLRCGAWLDRPCGSGSWGSGWGAPRWPACSPTTGTTSPCSSRRPTRSPVGAGIWLQSLGLAVLERLDLLDDLRAVSREVSRVEIVTARGRSLLDLSYAALPGAVPALGVHRGALFSLLDAAVRERGVPVELGVARDRCASDRGRHRRGDRRAATTRRTTWSSAPTAAARACGRSLDVTMRDHGYEYGALWSIVDDPRRARRRRALPVPARHPELPRACCPPGGGDVAVLVGAPLPTWPASWRAGSTAWRDAGATARRPVRRPARRGRGAAARDLPRRGRAHAVPARRRAAGRRADRRRGPRHEPPARHRHLPGAGRRLDPRPLPCGTPAPSAAALPTYARERAAHLRWYQWWTRLMMPVFQSDLGRSPGRATRSPRW